MGGLGASALAIGLKSNTSLKALQINGNDIGDLGRGLHSLTSELSLGRYIHGSIWVLWGTK